MRRMIGLVYLIAVVAPVGRAVGMPVQQHPRAVAARESVAIRGTPPLERLVTVRLREVPLRRVLAEIDRQAKLGLAYTTEIVPLDRLVTLERSGVTAGAALRAVLQGTGVAVEVTRTGRVALVEAGRADSLGTISGRVTAAATGSPVVGANVAVVGTALAAVTGDSGFFVIERVPRGERSVSVRFIGFLPVTKRVLVDSVPARLDFALEARAARLEELVTTATGQQRRRDIGNAITTIRADSVLDVAPIRSLTDLLDDRVPGLTVQHTSGAPGDPARLRLRGLGSVLRSNDPVVIVDGVRIYATQAGERSGNLTNLVRAASVIPGSTNFSSNHIAPAPSPLDQIDPNTIEKIEVLKGPSAATLYGADAANGVIVITTKKGRPGPTQWTARVTHGTTGYPADYPTGYFNWGHSIYDNTLRVCAIIDFTCVPDSLVRFQALNDRDLTILGDGHRTTMSLTASGGTQALTYSVTGSYGDEVGGLHLPAFEVERFRAAFNREAPDWMRRPHSLKDWSVSSNVTARLGSSMDVGLSSTLSRKKQQRSTLENELARLSGTYLDRVTGVYYTPITFFNSGPLSTGGGLRYSLAASSTYFSEYYQRTTASSIAFTTNLNANWRPRSWFTASGQAGLNVIPRDDQLLRPGGLANALDSGAVVQGFGRSVVSTLKAQGSVRRPLRWGFVFETNVGAELTTTNTSDLVTSAGGLVPGTTTIGGASRFRSDSRQEDVSVYGWYIEPRLTGERWSLSMGLRLDGGSAYGARVAQTGGLGNLLSLPRINGAWVISEEPWFPFASFVSSLKLRGGYGQAQVQPGPTDKLRLYQYSTLITEPAALATLGNTELRPERAVEFEGGVEADLLDGRMLVDLTVYRKTQVDALLDVTLPGSVNGGGTVRTNIGNIRNTGLELTLGVTPVRTAALLWSAQINYARNANTLTKLSSGVLPNPQQGIVEGYPVGGRWARPILGYADEDANGVLEPNEIVVGDSLQFMGRLLPGQTTSLFTSVALFGGAVGVTAGFSYESGAIQIDETARTNWVLARALIDPSTPLGDQAAMLASIRDAGQATDYGLMQDISTFRFKELSVNYRAPERVARLLRAQRLTIGVQGSNLGLNSTYRGKDPDVTQWSAGETIRDTGQLPLPRTWQVSLSLQY